MSAIAINKEKSTEKNKAMENKSHHMELLPVHIYRFQPIFSLCSKVAYWNPYAGCRSDRDVLCSVGSLGFDLTEQ